MIQVPTGRKETVSSLVFSGDIRLHLNMDIRKDVLIYWLSEDDKPVQLPSCYFALN
jgi:hypothetical protein